jgi:hypothetical protein
LVKKVKCWTQLIFEKTPMESFNFMKHKLSAQYSKIADGRCATIAWSGGRCGRRDRRERVDTID